jgi:hypothetical protein
MFLEEPRHATVNFRPAKAVACALDDFQTDFHPGLFQRLPQQLALLVRHEIVLVSMHN